MWCYLKTFLHFCDFRFNVQTKGSFCVNCVWWEMQQRKRNRLITVLTVQYNILQLRHVGHLRTKKKITGKIKYTWKSILGLHLVFTIRCVNIPYLYSKVQNTYLYNSAFAGEPSAQPQTVANKLQGQSSSVKSAIFSHLSTVISDQGRIMTLCYIIWQWLIAFALCIYLFYCRYIHFVLNTMKGTRRAMTCWTTTWTTMCLLSM